MLSRKCENCGGKLEFISDSISRCPYCGSTFTSNNDQAPINVKTPANVSTQQPNKPTFENTSGPANKKPSSLLAFVVIAFFSVTCIIVYNMTAVGHNTHYYYPTITDSPPSDTSTAVISNIESDYKKHIKRTNPERQILITKARVYTTTSATYISIRFKNLTDTDIITYIEFRFRVFDKNGNEIKADTLNNIRGTGEMLAKEHSNTESWQLTRRMPQAKSLKVELNKVEFGNKVWDY